MKKKNVTIYYGLIMAVYSLGFLVITAFSSVFLLNIGLSNGEVGILLAISSLLSVLLQPVCGSLIDRNPKVSSRGLLLVLSIIIVAVGIMTYVMPIGHTRVSVLLYGTAVMLLMLGQPFLNSLGVDAINHGFGMNLGVGRSIGSLGYALSSYGFGIVSVKAGYRSVPVTFSLAFLLLTLLLFFYPVRTEGIEKAVVKEDKKKNPWLFLADYKRFGIMLIGLVLVYFSHALINTFALQIVVPKGGTSESMGTASAIAAGCELITSFLFVWYMKKIRLNLILKISGIFFTLKILLSLFAPNVAAFYGVQALQMFGWGFLSVGIVYYVNEIMSDHDKAQGQAYAGMSYTIASVLATSLGGNIIDWFGVNTMLIAGTISAGIGTVIIWITAENTVKR